MKTLITNLAVAGTIALLLIVALTACAEPETKTKVIYDHATVVVTVEIEKRVLVPVMTKVPVEVTREVPVTRKVEVTREVPVEVTKEVVKITRVDKPVVFEKEVVQIVEIPVDREVEVTREVPATVEVTKMVPVTRTVEVTREVEIPVEITREVSVEVTRIVEVTRELEVPATRIVEVVATPTPVPPTEYWDSDEEENLLGEVDYTRREYQEYNHDGWYYRIRLTPGLYMASFGCDKRSKWPDDRYDLIVELQSLWRYGPNYSLTGINNWAVSALIEVTEDNDLIKNSFNIDRGFGMRLENHYLYPDKMKSGDYYLWIKGCDYDSMKFTVCRIPDISTLDARCPWWGHEVGY